jgi:hypothetical protein
MRGCDVAAWLDGIDVLDRVVVHLDDGFELAVWRRRQ